MAELRYKFELGKTIEIDLLRVKEVQMSKEQMGGLADVAKSLIKTANLCSEVCTSP